MSQDERGAPPAMRYEALVDVLLAQSTAAHNVREKRVFGSNSLTVGVKIFALLAHDRLVVKLPRARVDALVAAGAGERFDPGSGRQMKEWFSLDPDADEDWLELAQEALAFVGSRAK